MSNTTEKQQQKIEYGAIMALGFEEIIESDSVYFDQHGFEYSIIQLKLSKNIYLEWDKATKLACIIRTKKKKNIVARRGINTLEELKAIIGFYTKEDEDNIFKFDPTTAA